MRSTMTKWERFLTSIKNVPSAIYKNKRKKKKDVSKVLLSPFKVCTCRFPSWKAEQCRRRRVHCLWKRPSWVRNSLYGGSISRQVPFFLPCFKVQKSSESVDDLHSTVFVFFCLLDISGNKPESELLKRQTGTNTKQKCKQARTRKTSQSSDAWKKKTNRRFPECLQVYN